MKSTPVSLIDRSVNWFSVLELSQEAIAIIIQKVKSRCILYFTSLRSDWSIEALSKKNAFIVDKQSGQIAPYPELPKKLNFLLQLNNLNE